MIDTDKYEGHTTDWEWKDKEWGVALCGGDSSAGVCGEICCDTPDGNLAQDAPLLLEAYKRLQYLEKYAPGFQVFAQNEEEMEEKYTSHGSLKECEEYIAALEDGWIGRIEVIEYYVPTNNPQVKTLEEWRNEE